MQLAVATTLTRGNPAIFLKQPQQLRNFHSAILTSMLIPHQSAAQVAHGGKSGRYPSSSVFGALAVQGDVHTLALLFLGDTPADHQ